MRQEYGPVGSLRVQEAFSEGDHSAIAAATVQFYGTRAAADAHLWLGDRAFSSGDFAQALQHYRLAEENAAGELSHEVRARSRLVYAMLGQSCGTPVTAPVQLGSLNLSPAQFESLVASALGDHKTDETPAADTEAAVKLPSPTVFRASVDSRFDGSAGSNAG